MPVPNYCSSKLTKFQTVEIACHHSGYRPGIDQISSHTRKRYRFVSKNPTVAALPPDPSLWIVHYSQADPQNCIPAAQVGVQHAVRSQLSERQWIEMQGRLERQDFMLHDREKWPQLNMPGRGGGPPGGQPYGQQAYGQNPMAHIGNPRFSGQFYQPGQQSQAGPSPAKRQRQHPPSQMPASAAALMNSDTTIEDEENSYYGDILDTLTQRDISLTRYMQHHEWMEEVFSSPYATGQIVPTDLGFGLMGELAGLTEGLLDLPTQELDPAKDLPKKKDAPTPEYKKVLPEQLQEFESRIKVHMDKGQAELERMKEDHAKKLEALKKSKTLLQAEKRLRSSAWDVNDTGNEFWRIEKTKPASADHPSKEAAEGIVKEVEVMLGGAVQPQKEATVVEKGGLRFPEKRNIPPATTANITDGASNDMQMDTAFEQKAQPSDQYGQTTTGSEQQVTNTQPASITNAPPPQQPVEQPPHNQQTSTDTPDASMGNMDSLGDDEDGDDDNNLSLMDDVNMDMDVDTTLNFDTETPKTGAADLSITDWPAQQQQQQHQPSLHSNPTTSNANVTQTGSNPAPQQADQTDLFGAEGDTGFGDFDTGDGLIDFEGGAGGDDLGFDMDNSAFGDAFHNTESHGGDDGNGGGA